MFNLSGVANGHVMLVLESLSAASHVNVVADLAAT